MWTYHNGEIDEESLTEWQGFVYCITNLKDGRKYIGKKNLWTTKTRTKKGKKKREKVQSDWRTYFGSNNELLLDKEHLGDSAFKREILEFCKTKGELGYKELCYQMDLKVLEYPSRFYNSFVGGKFARMHIKSLLK